MFIEKLDIKKSEWVQLRNLLLFVMVFLSVLFVGTIFMFLSSYSENMTVSFFYWLLGVIFFSVNGYLFGKNWLSQR